MTIFNAGGFVWLALNHFKSVNKKLEDIAERLGEVEQDVAFIKGKCSVHTEDDE